MLLASGAALVAEAAVQMQCGLEPFYEVKGDEGSMDTTNCCLRAHRIHEAGAVWVRADMEEGGGGVDIEVLPHEAPCSHYKSLVCVIYGGTSTAVHVS